MRLFILGATGNIGRELVDLALTRGHVVTAYVRTPDKVRRREPSLFVQQGDVLEVERLSEALAGQDAVLSALGLPARRALRPSTFMAESMASTVAAMKRTDVQRLAVVSAAVLFPMRGLFYAFFRWLLQHHARDLSAMEHVLRATELDWTIAPAAALGEGCRDASASRGRRAAAASPQRVVPLGRSVLAGLRGSEASLPRNRGLGAMKGRP